MHKTHAKNKLRSVEYDLQGDLDRLKSALTDTTLDVKGRAGQILSNSYENIKNKSSDLQENVSEYVAERPFKSLGIAMLTGVVLGYFLRRG